MITKHSTDPDVSAAAAAAATIINDVLNQLPPASDFDYGGHQLKLDDYGVCTTCTRAIAEAQQARQAIINKAETLSDDTIREHLTLAAELFRAEAEAAIIRAEFHNGHGTEPILNRLLAYQYERHIGDDYNHSHQRGNK